MELGLHFIDFLPGDPTDLPLHWRRWPRPPKKPARRCSRSPTTSSKWRELGRAEDPFLEGYTSLGFLAAKTQSIT